MFVCAGSGFKDKPKKKKRKKERKKEKKRSNTRGNILKLGKRRALLISESYAHKAEFHLTRQDMTGP